MELGKSINLSETPGLGHYMGMKMSLKGWRDLREINLGTISTGGSQAKKQRHGPQTQLCLQVAWYSQASLLTSLDSVFPLL